ncbi:MAG: glycosyltransferase family 4 protein, partial [Candidatus Adiutrix sp.]
SYEILSNLASQINYAAVTDLIFVSNYMRNLFMNKLPGRLGSTRVHVIHNGIHLNHFPYFPGKQRKKIAFVGKLDYKKDPMLMMHAFAFLQKRHPELEMHVAGAPDKNRHYLAIPDMLAKNKLQGAMTFYGHVKDIPAWYIDKDFILCTSPFESQGVGLLEAMHGGLRPLIYSFPGAESLYPPPCLWHDFDELESLLLNGPDPQETSRFVAEKYSMERQAQNFLKVITGESVVLEPPPAL